MRRAISTAILMASSYLSMPAALHLPAAPSLSDNSSLPNLPLSYNGTNLTAPSPPPGFRTQLYYQGENEVNLIALFKGGMGFMYLLCVEDWDTLIPARAIMKSDAHFGAAGVGLLARTPETQLPDRHPQVQDQLTIGNAILGAYEVLTHMILHHDLHNFICELFLGQNQIGYVAVASWTLPIQASNNTTNTTTEQIALSANPQSQSGSFTDATHDLKITYTYDSTMRINSADLFTAFLDGLATAAEFKEILPCKSIFGVGDLTETGQAVVSMAEQSSGSLWYEMVKLVLSLVWLRIVLAKRMFGELDLQVFHKGVEIGTGRVQGLPPVSSSVQGVAATE